MPQLATPLLLATVAAVVLWFLVLLGVAFATRARGVDPGPAAMDLGEEPPAVVDLLTSDWRVTPDAVPATLLDLAARDYVDLEQHGPGWTVCRLRRTSAEGLEAYERMVLDHVVGLAVDGVVPAEALTTGPQDQSTRWWRAFRQAVVADARERGLARDRWSAPVKAFLRAAALVPAGLGVLYANAAGGLDFGTIGAGLVIWVVLTSSIRLFGDQRDTPAGAEAAARWLGVRDYLGRNEVFPTLPSASVAIWDRYLGYGAALGVATAALRAPADGGRGRPSGPVRVRRALAGGQGQVPAARLHLGPEAASRVPRRAGHGRRWQCRPAAHAGRARLDRRATGHRPGGRLGADRRDRPGRRCPAGRRLGSVDDAARGPRPGVEAGGRRPGGPQALVQSGKRPDRPLHRRGLRSLGQDHGMAGPRRRLRPLPGRRSGQGDSRSPAGPRLPARVRQRAQGAGSSPRLERHGGGGAAGAGRGRGGAAGAGWGRGEAAGAGWGCGGAAGTGRAWPGRGPGGGRVDGRRGRHARRPGDRGRPGPGGDGRGRGARPGGAGRPGAAADPAAIAGRPDARLPYQAASGRGSVSVFTAAGDLVGLLVRVNRRFGDPDQGLGDEAFLRGDTIVVIKGDIAASIRVQGDQVPDRVAALRRLASTAAPPPDGGRAGLRGSPAPPGTSPGPS